MMKSPIMRIVGMAVWVVTALAALALGLVPLGYNVLTSNFMLTHPNLIAPLHYLFLVSGVLSLVMLFVGCGTSCECCGSRPQR